MNIITVYALFCNRERKESIFNCHSERIKNQGAQRHRFCPIQNLSMFILKLDKFVILLIKWIDPESTQSH